MMNRTEQHLPNSLLATLVIIIIASLSNVNQCIAQCDPATIDPCEIGNNSIIQACYHAQIAKTSDGYSITGEDFSMNGLNNQTSLTNIPSGTYPMPPDVFPIWGAIGGRTQAVFLGSNGIIYAIGDQGLLIASSHTVGAGWSPTSLRLPDGITVCDVNKWEGAAGSGSNFGQATGFTDGFLVFSTYSGEAYITGDGSNAIQAGSSTISWTKLNLPNGVSVLDFGVGYRTLLIFGDDGNLYASGPGSHLGDGTFTNLNEITLLATQPPISVFGIAQVQAGYNSFMVLDGDGTIHVLGRNTEGALGVGNSRDVRSWSKVGAACADGVLENVAYISTMSTHDLRINSSAILVDGTIRSWGENDRQAITTGNDLSIDCPIKPIGTNKDAVAISNGGHISPYVNTNVEICNIGHNKDGAFGDGNDENGDYGEYTCRVIPGMPEICGTQEANLELEKTANDLNPNTGDDIVFTITVTNQGPEPSTGSFVRDQLTDGFFYLRDDSNGAYNSNTGLWEVGPLEVGESTSINITVKVIEAGAQTNYAQILVDNEVDITSTPGDNSANQDDDDNVVLDVSPCPIGRSDVLLCSGDSILIGGEWIYESGVFFETLPLAFDCDSLHIATVNYVDEPPMPDLQFDCETQEYFLSIDPNSIWNPTWDNGDNFTETTYNSSDDRAVLTLETDPNCIYEIITELPSFPNVDDIPVLEDTTVLEFTPVSINTRLDPDEWQIQWSPESIVDCSDCLVGNIIAEENTRVTISLEHITGCTFETSFFITVEAAPRNIFAPDIFSPNNDGINDEWTIFTTPNIQIKECSIFDRWGELVYQSKNEIPKWDGKFKGKDCASGVYVYVIKYDATNDSNLLKSGDVTLVR